MESTTRVDYWRYRDRNQDPEWSRTFADHNKDARSVTLDLKVPEGVALARRLAARSDVVIDNYAPGVMDRLGLGFAELSQDRTDAIVVHLNGLGSAGPRSHFVTFGPSLMSYVGMTQLWDHPGQTAPVGSQSSYPDYVAGVEAAFAIVTALHRRRRLGATAQLLDVSQALVTAAAIGPSVLRALNGEIPAPVGNQDATRAPHGCFPCVGGDDAWCVISVGSDQEWTALRAVMGEPAWAADPRFATAPGRLAAREELEVGVAGWTVRCTPREVMERCQSRQIAAGIVASGEDLAADPQLRDRGFLLELEHPRMGRTLLPGNPIRFLNHPLVVRRPGPLLGQDNDFVLRGVLGLRPDEISRLVGAGAIR